ncbi:DUF5818 domain-containing protein [Micromonospora sp. NPDC051006]|uniref:DUF5818 domain-containing protein n=1 Tax=Micromonospora sp. NPDC051006 TaxID=3364283 RepID=UPI0037B01260
MRRAGLLLTAVGLVCWVTACASSDLPAAGQPPAGSTAPAGATPPPAASPSPPARATPPPPPTTARPAPSRSATPPPSSGGDVPGALPWGGRTLTGTVERAGECTMLLVGEDRWALTGAAAADLRPGDRVTVHGNVSNRSAACGERALPRAVAVNRVEPA